MKSRDKKKLTLALAFLSLIAGISIYVFFREPPLLIQKLVGSIGLTENLFLIRSKLEIINLSNWILFGLPDLLWMSAFSLIIITIWNFKINTSSLVWIGITVLTGIGFEILQSTSLLKGVFDYYDLIYLCIGALLALSFTINVHEYEKTD